MFGFVRLVAQVKRRRQSSLARLPRSMTGSERLSVIDLRLMYEEAESNPLCVPAVNELGLLPRRMG